MTTCQAGCSACCNPVSLGFTQMEVYQRPAAFQEADWHFILDHLTPISAKVAYERNPWLKEAGLWMQGLRGETLPLYYECEFLDPTGLCNNYENRPPLCRTYPWAGDLVDPRIKMPPTCAFNADVGRPVEAVPVAIRDRAIQEMATRGIIS